MCLRCIVYIYETYSGMGRVWVVKAGGRGLISHAVVWMFALSTLRSQAKLGGVVSVASSVACLLTFDNSHKRELSIQIIITVRIQYKNGQSILVMV